MFYWRDISSAPNQFLLFAVPRRVRSVLAFVRILQVSQRKFSSSSFLNFRLCPWQNNRSFASCVLWSHCGEASMRKSLTKDQQASWGQIEGGGHLEVSEEGGTPWVWTFLLSEQFGDEHHTFVTLSSSHMGRWHRCTGSGFQYNTLHCCTIGSSLWASTV